MGTLQNGVIACMVSAALLSGGVLGAIAAHVPDVIPVDARTGTPVATLNALTAPVNHPLVPLATVPTKVFVGEELDTETGQETAIRVEETVLPRTEQVAGIEFTVVKGDVFHNGELVKTTATYFTQGPDGTVYDLGQRGEQYENAQSGGHEGAELAGDEGNQLGLFMPADPAAGDRLQQERVSGGAEERSTVIALDQTVTTAAGRFAGCIVTEGSGLPGGPPERKTYCPGVGLVREEFPGGHIALVQYASMEDVGAAEPEEQTGAIDDGQVFLSAAAITLEESIAAAQAAAPGEIGTVDLKVTNEGIVFVVEVGHYEVSVDAETGLVLTVVAED